MTDWEPRFWAKVDKGDGLFDCWRWMGASNGAGYGQFHLTGSDGKRQRYAHRLAYELVVGPIPEGLTLDHLCRNTRCMRPDHLEPVPMKANILRGTSPLADKARQTVCIRGHQFDRIYHDDHGREHRHCSTCVRLYKSAQRRVA